MSFVQNASPLGQGRSNQARDFARRASNKLLPWIKEHYEIYTLDQGAFTPGDLYNYHLRGDYYLGLTKDGPLELENLGLAAPGAGRLVHFAQLPDAYTGATSADLALDICNGPFFGGVAEYGVRGASAPIGGGVVAAHFFAREVANGSMLTEFLFAEQATMSYRLLPYMDNFHQNVRNFLVNEMLFFIDNIRLLQPAPRDNNNPVEFPRAVDLTYMNVPGFSILNELDAMSIQFPTFNTASVGVIQIPGMANPDIGAYPTFASIIGTVDREMPLFPMPIVLVVEAMTEYLELIAPDLDPATDALIRPHYASLLTAAVQVAYRLGGYYSLNAAGTLDFSPRFFTSQARTGNTRFRSVKYTDVNADEPYNQNTARNELQNFLDTYFNLVNDPFPIGTLVNLNLNRTQGNARQVLDAVFNGQTLNRNGPVPPNGNRLTRPELDAFFDVHGTIFEIVGVNTPIRRGRRNVRRYQLASRDAAGAPSAEVLELQNIAEDYGQNKAPAFVLHRVANLGPNNLQANTPLNIIGRTLLSSSYSLFNAGSYFSSQRDMRKLTDKNAPGHYPPLNEAMGPAVHGRSAHSANKMGIIDMYAEQRADLIADYLAAMYDSLKGNYRDAFVNFYDSDFHVNELSYYTNAVSNYISNQVAPQDANNDPVLVGPRLTTRLPPESSGAGQDPSRQIQNIRNADPELVYYQIDSPLLRDVLTQLNTSFYQWYTGIAEQMDRGTRNLTRAGNEEGDEFVPGTNDLLYPGISRTSGSGRDPSQDRQPVRPTKLIVQSMWPLLRSRAQTAVESGEVPAHTMLQQLALAVAGHRANTSQAVPAVPISTSFVNFGELLRSPGQYALPPSLSTKDIAAFIDYLEATYFNDYGLIGVLAANIETTRTINYNQDQLVSAFKKYYRAYRNTKALNRFTFSATANLVNIFRELVAVPGPLRAAEAARAADGGTMTTAPPPAPTEQPALSPPIPEPMRRTP